MYYIYDKDDYYRPKKVCDQNWLGEVVEEHENSFETKEEAELWRSRLNHRYISRSPYIVKEEEPKVNWNEIVDY